MTTNIIENALQIAIKAHEGQIDKDGITPSILHSIAVGLACKTPIAKCVGFLHDVIEDTEWTFEMLKDNGIPDEVLETLKLLTRDKENDPYFDYIQNIISSKNEIAIEVKIQDLTNNLKRGRCVGIETIIEKHTKALELITQSQTKQ